MKTGTSSLFLIVTVLLISCSNRVDNHDNNRYNNDLKNDSSSTRTSGTIKDTLTPDELEKDRREHPEKYLVTDVVLDENVKPHRYNVVLINNSPYKLKTGIVQVEYNVLIGLPETHFNTIHDDVEFKDVSPGDTSVVGSMDERGRKDHLVPLSHKVISTEFKNRKHK